MRFYFSTEFHSFQFFQKLLLNYYFIIYIFLDGSYWVLRVYSIVVTGVPDFQGAGLWNTRLIILYCE